MRLWSLHPEYLDAQGLVALWREALLAQKVLAGKTRGYKHHPQLERFNAQPRPREAMASYLFHVWKESCRRGYCFDGSKIGSRKAGGKIPVTRGQLRYESRWLLSKLKKRSPEVFHRVRSLKVLPHPLFKVISGPVAPWERIRLG